MEEPKLTVLKYRSWDSFRASLVKTTAGRFVAKQATETSMMFHLGPPAMVRCSYDGVARSRVQSQGKFDLIPVGCLASWDDFDPTYSLNVWLSGPLVSRVASEMKPPSKLAAAEPLISQEDARLFSASQLLKAELESSSPDDLFAESIATAMAVRLLQRYGLRETLGSGATLSAVQLRRVTDYIEANLDGDMRLATLAGLLGISESHFRVLFRQTLGRPVHGYVVDRRLRRARALLEAGNISIAEAALESGFCHQSHLARAMKREWKLTPSQIRRDAKAQRGARAPDAVERHSAPHLVRAGS